MPTLPLPLLLPLIAFLSACSSDATSSLNAQPALHSQVPHLIHGDTFDIVPLNPTFLGNFTRNYYGDSAPARLDLIWKTYLGAGITIVPVGGGMRRVWEGAGWTGQPLLFTENGKLVVIQGCYDHTLKKLDGETGEVIWAYEFDDVLKGTGTFWVDPDARQLDKKYLIMQGSRLGNRNTRNSDFVWSFRAVSFLTGQELWRFNSVRTESYARDVDASALVHNDTGYIGLENGIFMVFDPSPERAVMKDGYLQPTVYDQDTMYTKEDAALHGGNLVAEASPTLFRNHVYVPTGAGHVYGYNLDSDSLDWDFFTGSDIDGSMPLTADDCLILAIEKQYIPGKGGVLKLDPSKPDTSCVVWFFPTATRSYAEWDGGIIGSVTVNDSYFPAEGTSRSPRLACFTAIDGNFYVVEHTMLDTGVRVRGPDLKKEYATPKLVFKYPTGAAISTPVIVGNRIIVATYEGLYLFEYDAQLNFRLLDSRFDLWEVEATPVVHNGRIYLASRNGYLHCFGHNPEEVRPTIEQRE
jgi:outer membrane protein assembly factor BamB